MNVNVVRKKGEAKSAALHYLLSNKWKGTQNFINSTMAEAKGEEGIKKFESDLTLTNKLQANLLCKNIYSEWT